MSALPGSLPWFARHEFLLHWRELTAMLAGNQRRTIIAILVLGTIMIGGHWFAYALAAPWAAAGIVPDPTTLAQITTSGMLFTLMSLSQAMESVCRAYYTRADLDLILSSPASSRRLFIIRSGTIAATSGLLMALLVSPFINMLVWLDGPHWLAAYVVIVALSLFTTALAIAITLGLFRTLGPKRTRTASQVLAAIVGAALVVGIQLAIIMGSGQVGAIRQFMTDTLLANAPNASSIIWIPARAAMGDPIALAATVATSLLAIAVVLPISAASFARIATTATSVSQTRQAQSRARAFTDVSPASALRRKELLLLRRDPWLISQSLMQLFYLLPPGVLLWMNFGSGGSTLAIAAAIITMAAGQLAGGLAWITISGEDAHDFVATAPISPTRLYAAKVEAVLIMIAIVSAPFIVGIAIASISAAAITAIGIALAAASAIFIQLMFRVRGRRSQFSRRQTASRFATITEALVSITWAGATALAIILPALGAIVAVPAVIILATVWLVRRNATPL